jgi:hypothetical protein
MASSIFPAMANAEPILLSASARIDFYHRCKAFQGFVKFSHAHKCNSHVVIGRLIRFYLYVMCKMLLSFIHTPLIEQSDTKIAVGKNVPLAYLLGMFRGCNAVLPKPGLMKGKKPDRTRMISAAIAKTTSPFVHRCKSAGMPIAS